MANDPVQMIGSSDQQVDCGRGHACNFCPLEEQCDLDKPSHNSLQLSERLGKINWIIPVMANKGGVGKSTVSANLAVALARQGYSVGLADADIHGPNAPRLLGLQSQRSTLSRTGLSAPELPIEGRGSLRVGSLGFMLDDAETPVVWRDAYKHDYIHHLLGSFDWGVLDFLIVDMPPGTGNELITLADTLKGCNTSSLLVSSADAIALQDSLKAASYCLDAELPILGLVENHAGVICPHCGGEFDMFPPAPEAARFAEQGIDTLARLPFTPDIGNGAASGVPVACGDSPLAQIFTELAQACSQRLVSQQRAMLA